MTKPYGLTASFKVVVPTQVENDIWDAVCEAIESGMSAEAFLAEIREAWALAMEDKKNRDLEVLQ